MTIQCLSSIIFDTLQCEFDITKEQIKSNSKKRSYVDARKFICAFIKDFRPSSTLNEIGDIICRDHSTVHTSIKNHLELIAIDRDYRDNFDAFKKSVHEKIIFLT